MLQASILLLNLVLQIHANHFRNSTAVKPSKGVPTAPNPGASKSKTESSSKSRQDKEEAAAIGGLVKGLNALDGATGEAGAAMRQKYMTRNQALVTNSTKATKVKNDKTVEDKEQKEAISGLVDGLNKLPMRGGKVSPIGARIANLKKAALVSDKNTSKAHTQKAAMSKEDKENEEAIAGLVNGLKKLPMRDGKASPIAARMANIKNAAKNTALVSHKAPTAEVASKDAGRIQRAEHALEKADAAEKSVQQEAAEGHKDAQIAKETLKTKKVAAVLVSSTPPSPPPSKKPTKPSTPKARKEDKDEEEAVSSFVKGLAKIPMRNGKVSPVGARMATAAQRRKSALVSQAAPPAQKVVAASAKGDQKPTKSKDPKSAKEDKEEEEAVSSFVNGLSKIPMRNGKVSPVGARMATAAKRKKSALMSNAAPPLPKAQTSPEKALVSHSTTTTAVNARDAEQNKRIQHALEAADEEEKSVSHEEKEAHDEAEEARKIVKESSK
jgi:uncharacterized protein with von Willebrand factor type A (vWA) domain